MLRYLPHHQLHQQRVFVRVDFNVPIRGRRVSNDFRIRSHLPVIQTLLRRGARVILLSHHSSSGQSLQPVARLLRRYLRRPVMFIADPFRGGDPGTAFRESVMLVENLRFWSGEEAEDMAFAKRIARLGHVFVNDAFSVAHRRASSITLLPRLLPSYVGPLFERELRVLASVLPHPRRPLIAIFGGAKIETKLALLKRFGRLADRVLVGGAIANVFLCSPDRLDSRVPRRSQSLDREVKSVARMKRIVLPIDVVTFSHHRPHVKEATAIAPGDSAYDIGPKTIKIFLGYIRTARTVVWNGPLGLTEQAAFTHGTVAVIQALGKSRAKVIIGGGDTIAFLDTMGMARKFTHLSTGGGAMLAYLAGEKLPGLEAIKKSSKFLGLVRAQPRAGKVQSSQ